MWVLSINVNGIDQKESVYIDLKSHCDRIVIIRYLIEAMGSHVADDWKLVLTLLTFDFDALSAITLQNRSNWSHCETDLKNGKK